MSRALPFQNPTNIDRVNPEFIGIAEKYNEHRRNRIHSDRKHQNVSSHYLYINKVNQDLEKNLQDKQAELDRLKRIR